MAMYYGDSNGKAQQIVVTGMQGPAGPQGPQGPQGAPGPASGEIAAENDQVSIFSIPTSTGTMYIMYFKLEVSGTYGTPTLLIDGIDDAIKPSLKYFQFRDLAKLVSSDNPNSEIYPAIDFLTQGEINITAGSLTKTPGKAAIPAGYSFYWYKPNS